MGCELKKDWAHVLVKNGIFDVSENVIKRQSDNDDDDDDDDDDDNERPFNNSFDETSDLVFIEDDDQCDQMWRNLAALATF